MKTIQGRRLHPSFQSLQEDSNQSGCSRALMPSTSFQSLQEDSNRADMGGGLFSDPRFQSLQEDSNPTKKRVSTHFLDLSQSKNCIRQNNHKISIYLYRCYYSHISQCMSNYAIFCAIGHRQRSPIYHPAQYNRNLSYSLLPNHSLKLPEATLLVH